MSDSIQVSCPSCRLQFPLGDGVLRSVRDDISRDLQQPIEDAQRRLLQEREIIATEKEALERRRQEISELVDKQVAQELSRRENLIRQQAEQRAARKAAEENEVTLKALRQDRDEKAAALSKERQNQLALIAEKRQLLEEKEALELEVQRKLDQERSAIREEARKQADEEHRRQLAESKRVIQEMQLKLDEAQRKAAQGPIQRQGELFEQNFEKLLRETFAQDQIEAVSVGARGADLSQEVISPAGRSCGRLLYENKQTKNWQDAWITKLKSDMRAARADIGIIVTETLPKGIENFGEKDGVWVTNYASAIPLAFVLRTQLLEVTIARGHREGAREKMELLYEYLTGNEFRQRVQLVVGAFRSLREELDKERTYMTQKWNKREKQITTVMEHMAGMVGDVQGLSGGAIPSLVLLDDEDAATDHLELDEPKPLKVV